ncbi:MAG: hypothetical protein A2W25_07460 [candidate division Zixibacteria bacterium RBG_16_53_22]|nr:MAG: hypothetical protein A2W25_07460 [candidate division Zixibacteria bacterium RBG_16_53_22]
MSKLIKVSVAAAVLCLAKPAFPQTIFDAGAWTEFYTFKVPDQDNQQVRSLQGLRLRASNVGTPGLSFFLRGRVLSDLSEKLASDPDFRIFGAYAEYKRRDLLMLRVGRQFVSAGIGGFTMDGGRIDLFPVNVVKLTAFAGGLPGPSFYKYDRIAQWDDRNAIGGQLQYNGFKEFRPSISYLQRSSNNDLVMQAGGFDVAIKTGPYSEWAGLDYDFLFKHLRSGVSRTGIEFQGGHRAEFEYFYRRPSLDLSNVFSVFKNEPFHQVRLSPTYRINKKVLAQGSMSYTIFEDDENTRISLGGSYDGQSAGVVYSAGYAGTRLGIYSFLFYDLVQQLRVYLNADMYNYKLDTEVDDTTPSVATSFGALFGVFRGVSSRAELQLLSNRDFKYDTRFYFKIGYNFNSRSRTSGSGGGLYR